MMIIVVFGTAAPYHLKEKFRNMTLAFGAIISWHLVAKYSNIAKTYWTAMNENNTLAI